EEEPSQERRAPLEENPRPPFRESFFSASTCSTSTGSAGPSLTII
ncbi:hypothetical protein JTE90_029017, partial [Oedothorax gibbosus]